MNNYVRYQKVVMLAMLLVLAGACRSVDREIRENRNQPATINWPPDYNPDEATFFIHNSLVINAGPEVIWGVLTEAPSWPDWYEGARDVKLAGGHTVLQEDTEFRWTTMGLDFTSRIREFQPNERLSWESRKTIIKGYHGWLIVPTPEGSLLITDESQHGPLSYLERIFQPDKLHRLHDSWLAGIKVRAEERQMALKTKGTPGNRQ